VPESILAGVKKMIDIIIEEIIEYITEDLGNEKRKINRIVNTINWDLKRLYPLSRKKYHEVLSKDIEKYRELIEQIKGIRDVYQKGLPFVINRTKGKKKIFTLRNMKLSSIEFYLSHNREEEALEIAKIDANHIREHYSERSYYRFKNDLKKLGIEI
jgi:hypothetical protein